MQTEAMMMPLRKGNPFELYIFFIEMLPVNNSMQQLFDVRYPNVIEASHKLQEHPFG